MKRILTGVSIFIFGLSLHAMDICKDAPQASAFGPAEIDGVFSVKTYDGGAAKAIWDAFEVNITAASPKLFGNHWSNSHGINLVSNVKEKSSPQLVCHTYQPAHIEDEKVTGYENCLRYRCLEIGLVKTTQ